MKIQIKKDYFINELKKVTTVVGNNPINPILSNILLVAEQNELDIYGSNDLISIKSVIKDNIKIEKTGKCLISAKTFSGIVEKINEDEFEIEMIDATLRIKSDTYSCDLNTFNDADFYEVDFNESENKNILNFEFIKNINSKLLKIIPANKLLDNSPFRGILIDAERLEGFVEFIATDSFHLGYIKEPNNGQKYKFILNTELIKLLYSNNKDNSNYELFLKDNRVLVKNGNTYFNCSLVEGEFPNVAKILESPNQFFAKIKKNHLINAIEKAQILNESEANSIIWLNISNNTLSISGRDIDKGSSNETLNIESDVNEEFKISVNSTNLLNLIRNIDTETVVLEFTSALRPMIIKNDKPSNYVSLIMPMRN